MRRNGRARERRRQKRRGIIRTTFVTLVIIVVCFGAYVGTYYHADTAATDSFLPELNVEAQTLSDGSIAYYPEGATAGIIFYPGGKVEHTAYIPLMKALAENGIFTVLVKMPFNLAVFKPAAADGIREQFPDIESWYMAGHSLGGSMAASYVADNADSFDGLILLAAYSTDDLSEAGLEVLSVYGSLDEVRNEKKYEQYRKNLPEDLVEAVIEGGNHAGFGMYGAQKGDGEATITNTRQIKQTADIIAGFVK